MKTTGRKPGTPKTGGRKKGTPNKANNNLKEVVKKFLEFNMNDLQKQYKELPARDKLFFFEKLLKYVLPTQANNRIDFSTMNEDELDKIIKNLNNGG